MINRFLLWLTSTMPAKAIDLDGKYYIERYLAKRFKRWNVEIVLHRYLGSDGDRAVHDHPWRLSIGIPITGGYTDERVLGFEPNNGWKSKMVKIRPWRWNFISALRYHRIAYVEPGTWTLFITIKEFKGWGFAHHNPQEGTVTLTQHQGRFAHDWDKTAPVGWLFRKMRGTNEITTKTPGGATQ